MGNRTMTGYSTGTGNRLLSDGTFNYTYDDEGNLSTKTEISSGEVAEYTWDYRNRLTNVTVKDSSEDVIQESDYTYDAFDKRIGVSVDPDGDGQQVAQETWTVYDGANPYADFDGSESLTNRYLYGPVVDMILARLDDSGDIAWYLTDHLGSVRDLANTQGSVIDHVKYDSFGKVISESSPSNGDRFKFTGREYDEALEQYYYRARHYDPAVSRFVSEDPIGFAAGDANIFRYVGDNPVSRVDPLGLEEYSESGGRVLVIYDGDDDGQTWEEKKESGCLWVADGDDFERFAEEYEHRVEADKWFSGTIDRVRQYVSEHGRFDEIRFYDHGFSGGQWMGDDAIGAVGDYKNLWGRLSDCMNPSGTIGLYGCHVGEDPAYLERILNLMPNVDEVNARSGMMLWPPDWLW